MTQLNPTPTEEKVPAEDNRQLRKASRIAIIVLGSTLIGVVPLIFLAWQLRAWQIYALFALISAVGALAFGGLRLIRDGRIRTGMFIVLSGTLVVLPFTALLVSDLGLMMGLIIAVMSYVYASQTLQAKDVRRILTAGIVIGTLVAVTDFLNLEYRLPVPLFKTLAPVNVALVLLTVGFFVVRRAWRGSLRNKLQVSFIAVAVISTVALGAYMFTTTSNNLQENLERELTEVTNDRALCIGDLLNEQVNALTTLALNSGLQNAIEAKSQSYIGSPADIQATLDARDTQWRAADEAGNDEDPLVKANLKNSVARELIEYQQIFPENVEVFVTDAYGGLAGSTNRTSDYYQADEGWWQAAYNNDEGGVYISEPEFDESAGAIAVQIALPVHNQYTGKIVGILRTTFAITPLTSILTEKVGQTGEADIFFPGEAVSHIHEGEFGPAEAEEFEALQAVADQGMVEMEYEGVPSVVTQATVRALEGNPVVDNLGWVVVLHQQQDEAFAPITAQVQGIVLVLLIIVALAVAVAYFVSQVLVRPIIQLTSTAEEVSAGNLDSRAEVTTADEVGTLATTFNSMTSQLQETLGGLEQRVAERTKALETSTEVSRRLSTILDQDTLVKEVVEQLVTAFDYYYAHIYLFDEAKETLVMVGGTGEAGQTMLARGHTIPKGAGLVGRAGETNAGVLVPDTSQEEGWLPNELLPETRSEIAVPISTGDEVLGVFDVQHSVVNGLTEDAAGLMQALASQVAISLQNTRTYEQSRSQAELESLVNVIGQKIQRTTSMEETLQTAIRELGTAIGASRVKASLAPAVSAELTEPVAVAEPLISEVEGDELAFGPETSPAD